MKFLIIIFGLPSLSVILISVSVGFSSTSLSGGVRNNVRLPKKFSNDSTTSSSSIVMVTGIRVVVGLNVKI